MELRELVLSTLQEMDEKIEQNRALVKDLTEKEVRRPEVSKRASKNDDEIAFLKHTKERLEVLFAGLKSDEIKSFEQKYELTMKYLQLLLSQVDKRLENIG